MLYVDRSWSYLRIMFRVRDYVNVLARKQRTYRTETQHVKRDLKVRVSYFLSSVSSSRFRKKLLQQDYWTDKMAGQPEK
jgi:hypothetical protein